MEPSFSGFSAVGLYNSIAGVIFPEITFAREILPRKASANVLNTNTTGLPFGSTGISTSAPSFVAFTGAIDVGAGTRSMNCWRTSFTPSPVMEQHLKIGTMSPWPIPFERPRLNSSSVNSPLSKKISINSSSVSAIASERASLSSRVTTEVPNFALRSSITFSTFTFSLSVFVRTKNFGVPAALVASQAFSVPTCIPDEASTKMAAASTALSADCTSPAKSKKPGVSRKLSFTLLNSTGTSVVLMEYPFSISILS